MKHLEPEEIEAASVHPERSRETEEHLASCAECRGSVRRAQGRRRMLSGLRPYTLSDMAFRRVEARLDEAVAAGDVSPSPWRWLWWVGGAAVAAALALIMVSWNPTPTGVVKLPRDQVASAAPFYPLTVVRAVDAKLRRGDSAWSSLAVGGSAVSGDALSAQSLVLTPEQDVPWALFAEGSLSLGGAASLTLGAGEVVAKVGSPIEVLASTRRMMASNALFAVSRTGAEVVLRVGEGEVEVIDAVTGERRLVKAPQALRWSDGSSLKASSEVALGAVVAPIIPGRPWVRFDASELTVGTMVSLDGMRLGAAPFMELVTAGRRRLGLLPPGGVLHESWAELIGDQPFTAKLESPVIENDGPEPDAEALGRVMTALRAQRPRLSACYDKWLKANPSGQGEVMLELLVNAQGRVKKASVEKGAMNAASAECLVTTAKSLVLPPLGVEATLELPVILHR